MLALRQAGPVGLTRTEIANIFGRHLSTDQLGRALRLLAKYGKARQKPSRGGHGRPPRGLDRGLSLDLFRSFFAFFRDFFRKPHQPFYQLYQSIKRARGLFSLFSQSV